MMGGLCLSITIITSRFMIWCLFLLNWIGNNSTYIIFWLNVCDFGNKPQLLLGGKVGVFLTTVCFVELHLEKKKNQSILGNFTLKRLLKLHKHKGQSMALQKARSFTDFTEREEVYQSIKPTTVFCLFLSTCALSTSAVEIITECQLKYSLIVIRLLNSKQ